MSENGSRQGRTRVRLRSFSNALPMQLLAAREAVMSRFRPSLREFAMTEQQWRVLRTLSSVEVIEVSDLASATHLLGPSLSRILRDLERRGLIARRAAPEDLRRSLVSISTEGFALIDRVAPTSEAIYAEITDAFGVEKMERLQELLKDLANALAAPARDADTDGDADQA